MSAWIRTVLACLAAALVAVPLAEAGAAAQPRLGFYNCYSKGYPIVYQGTVQLQSGGRYGWGYLDTANRRLKQPKWGAYRASGSRIRWSGGALAQVYGVVKTPEKFEIWVEGERFASYWCYFKF